MTSTPPPKRIAAADLGEFVAAILAAAGVEPAMAKEWAAALVWANLRGVDTHGVMRLPRYVDLLAKGQIKARPAMRVDTRGAALSVLEADLAPGPVGMARAMDAAIASARAAGVGWCAARNITHAGAIGYTALRAAEAGMAGIVMTASGPLMAYHGARVAGVSTNPLAIAFPGKTRAPILFDMATSSISNGRFITAKEAGTPLPTGAAIDATGHETTDPRQALTLTPVGGPKGSGLSLLIECLTSVTLGNPIIAAALASGGTLDAPYLNGAAIALDLAAFGNPDAIRAEADRLGDAILALPRADGVEQLYLPGGRGDASRAERERTGIAIAAGTWSRLTATARTLGVAVP